MDTDETKCSFVSSRGILKSCDVAHERPVSSSSQLPDLTKMYDNCTVYVCNTAIRLFACAMDEIHCRFILVSGDSDNENYSQIFTRVEEFNAFISNDKLIHWFSQNANVSHPKLTHLPIGLDYHTVSGRRMWGEETQDPVTQEQAISELRRGSFPFKDRVPKCYINFTPRSEFYVYDRIEALRNIPDEVTFKEHQQQKRSICWKNQTQFSFVVSPFGNGMDCHRTWEALVLGNIPIVRTSGLDPLFADLPVLIINHWGQVNQKLLSDTIEVFQSRTFNYNKLNLQFWVDKIRSYKEDGSGPAADKS